MGLMASKAFEDDSQRLLQGFSFRVFGGYWLSELSHHDSLAFKATRMRCPVWPNKPVDAELRIMYRIPKVSSIAPILHRFAILVSGGHKALVYPVPNEATLLPAMQSLSQIHQRRTNLISALLQGRICGAHTLYWPSVYLPFTW